jgi:carbon-monoxide dehydrogenase medium subunit
VKPPAFEYERAQTVAEALSLLGRHGPEAKVLAGGQSLIPVMKLRLARPAALVDINRVRELAYTRVDDRHLAFGALARLSDLETEAVRARCPVLTAAARHIGHPAIRHRGTVCGSLAHADPAGELPVLAVALEAEMGIAGPGGRRSLAARDFFRSYFETAVEPGEILVEARFPAPAPGVGWSFHELARRHGDFALVSAACLVEASRDGKISVARIALGSVADRPVRASEAEALLVGAEAGPARFEAAARAAAAQLDPPSDVHGSGAYRRHLAQVLVERGLAEAWGRARS